MRRQRLRDFLIAIPPVDSLYRITAPWFCAGLIVANGSVTRCAPILRRRFMGAVFMQVVVTCVNEGWVLEHVG